jgi:hypothetical protein
MLVCSWVARVTLGLSRFCVRYSIKAGLRQTSRTADASVTVETGTRSFRCRISFGIKGIGALS